MHVWSVYRALRALQSGKRHFRLQDNPDGKRLRVKSLHHKRKKSDMFGYTQKIFLGNNFDIIILRLVDIKTSGENLKAFTRLFFAE